MQGDKVSSIIYDASGLRLKKETFVNGTKTDSTSYINGMEYFGDVLQIYHEDGVVQKMADNSVVYNYYLKDHLGNIRYLLTDKNNDEEFSGSGEIKAYHYFPFGMEMAGSGMTNNATGQYRYNNKEFDPFTETMDFGARSYRGDIGRFLQVDPLSSSMPSWSSFSSNFNNPIRFTDPTGMAPEDFVQDASGNIRWDKNANSQATTKTGEIYLGKTLTFNFNSYIDKNLWDGPMGDIPVGDKLTSTVVVRGNENNNGELTSLSATKSIVIGETPIGTARDYYPGEGGSNNSLSATTTSTGVNINFEQHASVSPFEQVGMNVMGYNIVDVAQKLNIDYNKTNGNLAVSSYTGVFPSASLSVNGSKIMQHNQPSFVRTHSANIIGLY